MDRVGGRRPSPTTSGRARAAHADARRRATDMSSAQGGHSRDRVASQQMSAGGLPGGRRPAQKTFAGYSEKSELAVAGQRVATPPQRKAKRSHPWLDYPPDFERKMAGAVVAVMRVPGLLLSPLPPAVRFSLSRNFGFVTKTFTQFFDKDGVSSVQESIGLK